jgi:hypothetical protein
VFVFHNNILTVALGFRTYDLVKRKLKMVDLKFDKDSFLKKIKSCPEKKIYLDLAKFLPINYRRIIPKLKERLISLWPPQP